MWTVQLITQPGISYPGWWSIVHEHLFPVWTGSPKVTMDHACKGGAWTSQDPQNIRIQRDRQTEDSKSAGHCGGKQQGRLPLKQLNSTKLKHILLLYPRKFNISQQKTSIHLQYIEDTTENLQNNDHLVQSKIFASCLHTYHSHNTMSPRHINPTLNEQKREVFLRSLLEVSLTLSDTDFLCILFWALPSNLHLHIRKTLKSSKNRPQTSLSQWPSIAKTKNGVFISE